MNTTTRKEDNPNSSQSVEASLEDFIAQANSTFPASDGWDLHTGDVELVDDEEALESAEHIAAPIVVKPAHAKAEAAAHLIKRADQSARARKVSAAMLDDPDGKTTVAPAPTRSSRRNPFEVALPLEEEPAPLDPPPTGPRRRGERTEVVAAKRVPWTANPMVWIAGVFAAFVAGAAVVFVMVRTMMPSTPVVVQAPAPVVLPATAVPPPQPVVTPLEKPAQASAPKVTPLEQPKPSLADIGAATPVEKHAAKKASAPKHAAVARHEAKAAPVAKAEPKSSAPVAKAAPAKAPAKAAAASDDDDDDDSAAAAAPAPKKASKKPAKAAAKSSGSGGGDWVDPFAQ